MEFFTGPEDLLRLLAGLGRGGGEGDDHRGADCPCGSKHGLKKSIKLDDGDLKIYNELIGRNQALRKGFQRAQSKIESDAARNWGNLKDKYNLHGEERLHINGEEGVLEVLEP